MRKARLRETLLTVSLPLDQRDLVDTLCMNLELYPIELRTEDRHIEVEPAGVMEGTGEQVYCYTLCVPFAGDAELWMFRADEEHDWPDGEYFRLRLILAVHATSMEEGERLLQERLAIIETIISRQTRQIESFNANLPAIVRDTVQNYCAVH